VRKNLLALRAKQKETALPILLIGVFLERHDLQTEVGEDLCDSQKPLRWEKEEIRRETRAKKTSRITVEKRLRTKKKNEGEIISYGGKSGQHKEGPLWGFAAGRNKVGGLGHVDCALPGVGTISKERPWRRTTRMRSSTKAILGSTSHFLGGEEL